MGATSLDLHYWDVRFTVVEERGDRDRDHSWQRALAVEIDEVRKSVRKKRQHFIGVPRDLRVGQRCY
ncbi:hypothetical protein B296_00050344 [Ensete ventricosum]|uniref:Uncharacterized protein n=1 Tax=Ensete ventricosum TaxID=4639 RepID=A0A426XNY5_ENSVE|nr:hypothetical protein B296_00050344 [Ensete ventricosum]